MKDTIKYPLVIYCLCVAVIVLYPPWMARFQETPGRAVVQRPIRYAWVFAPPKAMEAVPQFFPNMSLPPGFTLVEPPVSKRMDIRIDFSRLALSLVGAAAIIIVGTVLAFLFGLPKLRIPNLHFPDWALNENAPAKEKSLKGSAGNDMPMSEPMRPWSWFLIVFAIAFCWLSTWASAPASVPLLSADSLGGFIVLGGVPFAIAYAVRGRKKRRDWNSFARWFFWLALIITSLVYQGQRN